MYARTVYGCRPPVNQRVAGVTRIPRARDWGFLTASDREEPVGGTRSRRGIFATHEQRPVGQAGIL